MARIPYERRLVEADDGESLSFTGTEPAAWIVPPLPVGTAIEVQNEGTAALSLAPAAPVRLFGRDANLRPGPTGRMIGALRRVAPGKSVTLTWRQRYGESGDTPWVEVT